MDRLTSWRYAPAIRAALDIIPEHLRGMVACDFLCGTDPVFAGLHAYEDANSGRSYRNTAHCTYSFHQVGLSKSSRKTTIVLPVVEHPRVIVHELGHVLHEVLGFGIVTSPVSAYAHTDRYEAFAEAFTSWLVPGYAERPAEPFLALMDSLT